ncbi:MAG: sulfotransferase [Candidatus Brocadia sp.]|jgi:hypothetical protein
MEAKLPNFLIVGAAKSGTTSLYYYLNQHPEVYMSPIKEPGFFIAQFLELPPKRRSQIIENFDDYKKLFKNVRDEKAIGEATPAYLYYYENTIRYILDYLGDVKIIIILRNPVDRAFSDYQMRVRNSGERLSFEDALLAEDKRKNMALTYGCGWHYKSVGFYYNQVKAYMENFSQVRVYLYDELLANPSVLMKDVYAFLSVDTSFPLNTDVQYNVGGVPKNKFVHNILVNLRLLKSPLMRLAKVFFPDTKMQVFLENFRKRNLEKIKMKPETREYLVNLYRDDILKLQGLINKDLSHWLQ